MNETLQTIYKLRSERQFLDKAIKQEDLDTILEASIHASNASSRQGYSIIVLQDKEKMREVCGYTGAAVLVYCVDCNRLLDIAKYMNQDYEISTTIDFITGSTDTVLAAQTAVIAATSLGIDSLITNGVHRQDYKKISGLLNLPSEYCFPVMALVLGYSAAPEKHYKGRIKTGVIHYDTYHHLTDEEIEEEMAKFDSKEKKYGLTSYTQWEAMGFKHYYEWFYQVWTKHQENDFYSVLKETKFFD